MQQCSNCKAEYAYIGLNEIKCLNPMCRHFSQKYLDDWLQRTIFEESEEGKPRIEYLWTTQHIDCGD